MVKYDVCSFNNKEILLLKTLQEMSPKWAKKAHFSDISYNVFNRRKSSYLMIEILHFTISWRMGHFNESNHQIWSPLQEIYCMIYAVQDMSVFALYYH